MDNIPYQSFKKCPLAQLCRFVEHSCYAALGLMAKLPRWYLRVPEMLAQLRTPATPPFLDRPLIEELFRVSRRQAIRLLGAVEGYQLGKTFLVDRETLIAYLAALETSGQAPQARARKQRVALALQEVANHAAAQRVQVRTTPDVLRRRPADLPAAIELLAPGKLQISYHGAEDLLANLVELAAAATNDFHTFRKLYEGAE
jgi:hypothetical protein